MKLKKIILIGFYLIIAFKAKTQVDRHWMQGAELGINYNAKNFSEIQLGLFTHNVPVREVPTPNYNAYSFFLHGLLKSYRGKWDQGIKLTTNYTLAKNYRLIGADFSIDYYNYENNSLYLGLSYTPVLSRFTFGVTFPKNSSPTIQFGINFHYATYPNWFW